MRCICLLHHSPGIVHRNFHFLARRASCRKLVCDDRSPCVSVLSCCQSILSIYTFFMYAQAADITAYQLENPMNHG